MSVVTNRYRGTIVSVSEPNSYANVGDSFAIHVSYDPKAMSVSDILVNLSGYGDMHPLAGSTVSNFTAPDQWDAANDTTKWEMIGTGFTLRFDNIVLVIQGHVFSVTNSYCGAIDSVSGPNPYAKVGDTFEIKVSYDPKEMRASNILVRLSGYGDMHPLESPIDSSFTAPDQWYAANTTTKWEVNGTSFTLESDGFGVAIHGLIQSPVVVKPPAPPILKNISLSS